MKIIPGSTTADQKYAYNVLKNAFILGPPINILFKISKFKIIFNLVA